MTLDEARMILNLKPEQGESVDAMRERMTKVSFGPASRVYTCDAAD